MLTINDGTQPSITLHKSVLRLQIHVYVFSNVGVHVELWKIGTVPCCVVSVMFQDSFSQFRIGSVHHLCTCECLQI